ncbi:MAG: Ig-like domain-containing protein [Bacteroidota bacterium]
MRTIQQYTAKISNAYLLLALSFIFTSASAQLQIISPDRDSTVSPLTRQAITARSVSGFDAELYVNGVFASKKPVRLDGLVDFINTEVPAGPVVFEVRIVNPDGSVAFSEQRFIHILGSPAAINLESDSEELPADGTSSMNVRATVFDQWGYPIADGSFITVGVDSGSVAAVDADSSRRGIQIPVINGAATFEYRAGSNAGVSKISIQIGQLFAEKEINLNTPKEPLTLVGLATGMSGMYSAKGNRSVLFDEKTFPDGIQSEGRVAMYARGTVLDEYLLTASIDTDRKNRGQYFRELDPDYLYSIYGDNSMLFYDIQTNRNLFIKLEKNQTFGMIGDFNTELTGQEFISYNRTLNGLKFGHRDKLWKITGFGSLTDRRATQIELRGTGLSGFYDLGNTDITPGTEKVRIETRDKFHSEVLLKVEHKYRYSDYDIDYTQGTIFFKQPVQAVDQIGNPIFVMVSFEAKTGNEISYIAGGRAEHQIANNFSVGITAVSEEQSPSNFTLMGTDAKYSLGSLLSVSGEFARSSAIGGTGIAYKFDARTSPIERLRLNSYYRRVEAGFTNETQIGGRRELGTIKYGVGGDYSVGSSTKLQSEMYRTNQTLLTGGVNELQSISGGVEHKFVDNFKGQVRIEEITYDGANPDSTKPQLVTKSTLGSVKFDYSYSQQLKISGLHERNFGPAVDVTRANATSLIGEYAITENISLNAQEKFYEDGGMLSTVGFTSTVFENTQAYGSYEIGNAVGNYRNQISIGLKNKIKLRNDLTSHLGYERTKGLGQRLGEAQTNDHSAYSAALEYLPTMPLKLAAKVEFGEDSRSDKTNFTFGGDYRFEHDFSLILKYRDAKEIANTVAGYRDQDHLITGLAYRPVNENWLNLLAKYEVKSDRNHFITPFIEYNTSIISVHMFVEPIRLLEVGVKYAYKNAKEHSQVFDISTNTNFYLVRGEYDITEYLSFGAEYRLLHQIEAGDMLNGYSVDAGYAVYRNVRVHAGYNFKGYKEKDLIDYTLWSQGPFVRLSFKFSEEILGL